MPSTIATESEGHQSRARRRTLRLFLIVAVIVAAGVLAVWLFVTGTRALALRSARIEFAKDFPGFEPSKFESFAIRESGFDSAPYSGVNFELRLKQNPALRLVGTYYLTGHAHDSGIQLPALRDTIFNGSQYSASQITGFANEWTRAYPRRAIAIGDLGDFGTSKNVGAPHFAPSVQLVLMQHFNLGHVYGFLRYPINDGDSVVWFYFDDHAQHWRSLGTQAAMLREFGR